MATNDWPELDYVRDHGTFDTLHLMTQVVGKVRLAQTPWINHSWHVPLYLSARGLETSLIPHPAGDFDLAFDFIAGRLDLRVATGATGSLPLKPGSIADFHRAVLDLLHDCGVPVSIDGKPNEIPDAVPFARDVAQRPYDPDAAMRLWRTLVRVDRVLKRFRSGFLGKASPVHFFWGSFDLATTRFSGRTAPPHPGGVPNLPDAVAREAYSHEVFSAGFWSGGGPAPYPLLYAYAYPEPKGFREATGLPPGARFEEALGEYVMPYNTIRAAADPEAAILAFLQATYVAAADNAAWDRAALECALGVPGVVRGS